MQVPVLGAGPVRGAGRSRSVAAVITPSAPSDPTNSEVRSRPATFFTGGPGPQHPAVGQHDLEPQYGVEQLAESERRRVVHDHRSYVGRAKRADREWARLPRAQWIEQLRVEHANIRAALGGPCHQRHGGRAAA